MDKSISIFLKFFFTIGGTVILLTTWLQPMPLSERIAPSIIGAAGVISVITWVLILRSRATKVRIPTVPAKTGIKKKAV